MIYGNSVGVGGVGGYGGPPGVLTRALQRSARPVPIPYQPPPRTLPPQRARPVIKPPALNADEIIALHRHRRRVLSKLAPRSKRRDRLSVIEFALGTPAERTRHTAWLDTFLKRIAPPLPPDRPMGRGWVP